MLGLPRLPGAEKLSDLAFRYGYVLAVGAVLFALAILFPFQAFVENYWPWAFLLVVGFVASWAGVGPAITAAILCFLLGNVFFVRPYYTLNVASRQSAIELVVFLIVAVAWGVQSGRLREQEIAARTDEERAMALAGLSASLALETSAEEVVSFATQELKRLVGIDYVVLWLPHEAGHLSPVPQADGSTPTLPAASHTFAEWAYRESKAIGLGPMRETRGPLEAWPISVLHEAVLKDAVTNDIFLPLQTATGLEGVLECAGKGDGTQLPTVEHRTIVAVTHLIAAFLSSRRMAAEAAQAEALKEADRLKAALISSVSHELKTPLASITAAVTDIADENVAWDEERARSRLASVGQDLDRLDGAIANLLDVSRLEANAWLPAAADYEVGEIVGDVVSRFNAEEQKRISFSIPDDLPPVRVDFTQLSRALRGVLENALIYSPAGSPVVVGADQSNGEIEVWVEDEGPGIPQEERPVVFDKFFRGKAGRESARSTGLGLYIVKEIVEANDGSISVQDAEHPGTRFVIRLPSSREVTL